MQSGGRQLPREEPGAASFINESVERDMRKMNIQDLRHDHWRCFYGERRRGNGRRRGVWPSGVQSTSQRLLTRSANSMQSRRLSMRLSAMRGRRQVPCFAAANRLRADVRERRDARRRRLPRGSSGGRPGCVSRTAYLPPRQGTEGNSTPSIDWVTPSAAVGKVAAAINAGLVANCSARRVANHNSSAPSCSADAQLPSPRPAVRPSAR